MFPEFETSNREFIMKEKIDLSLNRSLEELITSYWEAENSELDLDDEIHSAFYALEDYLSGMGAL